MSGSSRYRTLLRPLLVAAVAIAVLALTWYLVAHPSQPAAPPATTAECARTAHERVVELVEGKCQHQAVMKEVSGTTV